MVTNLRSTKNSGDAAEARALQYLEQRGLKLVERNYRVAQGRSRLGGEIDLIMRDKLHTLIFVEVRARQSRLHGGSAQSVSLTKQRRLLFAAQCYLQRFHTAPACRFDVVAIEADSIEWLVAAFDAK